MREAGIPLTFYGIRLDSGDLAYLSKQAKKMLDEAGFSDAVISASNDLDEFLIDSLKIQGATINSWGVGTNLITSKDCPSFGGVYKLAAILDRKTGQFIPKIKLSENTEKVTNPGNKTIRRVYNKNTGKIIADLICLVDEVYDCLLYTSETAWNICIGVASSMVFLNRFFTLLITELLKSFLSNFRCILFLTS